MSKFYLCTCFPVLIKSHIHYPLTDNTDLLFNYFTSTKNSQFSQQTSMFLAENGHRPMAKGNASKIRPSNFPLFKKKKGKLICALDWDSTQQPCLYNSIVSNINLFMAWQLVKKFHCHTLLYFVSYFFFLV